MRNLIIPILIAVLASAYLAVDATSSSSSETASQSEKQWAPVYVDAGAAHSLIMRNPDLVVLDVRTPEEYDSGHIEGAVNVNFYDADFEAQLARLDADAHYLIHCRSGGRSTKALKTMKKLGFTDVAHLDGGFNAWQKAGLPEVK